MSRSNKKKVKFSKFRPMILSRHPSHGCLRSKHKNLPLLNTRSVVRLGSVTKVHDTIENGGDRIEINTIDSIKNSSNKLLMKRKFQKAGVKTAIWIETFTSDSETGIRGIIDNQEIEISFPIVTKQHYGSKGKGNTLIRNYEEFSNWKKGKTLSNYIFEKFVNFGYEYRLHVTEEFGCFYTCRKALKEDVKDEDKWRRHDDNCVWFLEDNDHFYKPASWEDIEQDCIKALKAIGADILSFDVKVQTSMTKDKKIREYQDYILIECNSASSMSNGSEELSVCAKKYIQIIPQLITNKINKQCRK